MPRKSTNRKTNKKTKKGSGNQVLNRTLEQINLHAAGVDVGSEEMWVAVPPGSDREDVRRFGAYTRDLYAIADWLEKCGVKTVALESTGVYWVPLYEVLEERGYEVRLVDASRVKHGTAYVEESAAKSEEKYRAGQLKRLSKQLAALGYELTPKAA
jgi:transposase